MENIIEPTSNFDFSQLNLENPSPLQGGNFFTKINYTDKKLPLYIQLPKCKTKQGIIKNTTSKKSFVDLLYNFYDYDLISWFEGLELKCRELIFEKKNIWFQSEMDLDDIENMFISPTRSYKSGKMLIIRAHIPYTKQIKKDYCMIYDENERIMDTSDITNETEVIPLICVDGIKFSSKSFQLDINLPQLMVLRVQDEIKNGFMIKHQTPDPCSDNLENSITEELPIKNNLENILDESDISEKKITLEVNEECIKNNLKDNKEMSNKNSLEITKDLETSKHLETTKPLETNKILETNKNLETNNILETNDALHEVNLDVNDINETISLKKQSEVYYEIYKAAREKAKHMRQAAIEAYLEARNIKTKFMLDDIGESDDNISNFSEDEENSEKPT
uniref:Uncharacterized protein n=1 Tax=viral metagenome TaxID=1070528 RepID=A0A6C0AXJ3_9ZZZZ|tara:strand:- start:4313 stop:5491 length:1179 start_codon:yes stop_codon:yes gene_type:complete